MKISKKRLRERLIDIANGAGMQWDNEHQYFENITLENVSSFQLGISHSFDIDPKSDIFFASHLPVYEDLGRLVNFMHSFVEHL